MLNKYDERYDIRLAKYEDIEDIMGFINKHWQKDHILSQDRVLFEYEYLEGEDVNFILAIDRETNSIEATLGFIKSSNTKNSRKRDIWGTMWKVNDDKDNIPLLGVELSKRIFNLTDCRTYISNGTNPKTTIPIRELMFGDKGVKMDHYYYLNPYIDQYKIAIINKKKQFRKKFDIPKTNIKKFENIKKLRESFKIEDVNQIPYKDSWYFNKRYFNHPYYKYLVYGLEKKCGNIGALLVAREISLKGRKILRIVDYIGEQMLFSGMNNTFEKFFKENKYEYIDFYTYGFEEVAILNCGFNLRDENDENKIPDYFKPFVQENIDIWCHYKFEGTLFFKADGDQDRPN